MTDLLVTRGATFSRDGANRLILTRRWADGPQVCFIGLNPSTADHLVDDPTVRRWMHFGRAWGFGGIVAVNLYPFRSSSPDECRRWADWECNGQDWYARDDIHHNCSVVAQTAKLAKLTVACWGAAAWDLDWVEEIVEGIATGDEPWPDIHCFGETSSGTPIHPMARGRHRVPDNAQPVLWRAA
jgi:hypothetical protein